MSLKNVTKQISNIHIRCRTALIELAAVNLLTEAVSFFNGVAKQRNTSSLLSSGTRYRKSKISCCYFRLRVLVFCECQKNLSSSPNLDKMPLYPCLALTSASQFGMVTLSKLQQDPEIKNLSDGCINPELLLPSSLAIFPAGH